MPAARGFRRKYPRQPPRPALDQPGIDLSQHRRTGGPSPAATAPVLPITRPGTPNHAIRLREDPRRAAARNSHAARTFPARRGREVPWPLEGRGCGVLRARATGPSRFRSSPSSPTSTASRSPSCCLVTPGQACSRPAPKLVIDLEKMAQLPRGAGRPAGQVRRHHPEPARRLQRPGAVHQAGRPPLARRHLRQDACGPDRGTDRLGHPRLHRARCHRPDASVVRASASAPPGRPRSPPAGATVPAKARQARSRRATRRSSRP